MKVMKSNNPNVFDYFFRPKSIALIGASERGMYPAGIIKSLLDNGYSGRVYPINPNRDTVFAIKTYPSIRHLPEPVDLAVFTIPREAVNSSLNDCRSMGIPAALIITAGFSEFDDEGKNLENEMRIITANGGIRIVGPNCAGLANIPERVVLARLPGALKAGDISLVSQSGALMMALYGLFSELEIGLNKLISMGNQVDLSLADAVEYLVGDSSTKVIAAFLEDMRHGFKWTRTAISALKEGKPLVFTKSGRTPEGQKVAASHTAALAGSDKVFQAFCRQFGVVLTQDIKEFIYTSQLFSCLGSIFDGTSLKVAVITQSGGMGSLTADFLSKFNIQLSGFGSRLQEKLKNVKHLKLSGEFGNPVDVRGEALIGVNTIGTLQPFFEEEEINAVAVLFAKPLFRPDDLETAEALIKVQAQYQKPLFVVWVGPRRGGENLETADQILLRAGIPVFEQPSDFAKALGNVLGYYRYRKEWLTDPESVLWENSMAD